MAKINLFKSQKTIINNDWTKEEKAQARKAYFKRNICIYLMIIPVVIWFLIFAYAPLYYLRMAFYDYKYRFGFAGSDFILFDNFIKFFADDGGWIYVRNTLIINLLALAFVFPIPIVLAIAFNEINNKIFKRSAQTISYLPHFLSTTALVGIIYLVFDSGQKGLINNIILSLNQNGSNISFLDSEKWFRPIQVISGVWQTCGWNTIVYTAALTAIDPQLYEVAKVEGASRWQAIKRITLPSIVPTILIMLTMQLGGIMNSNFDKIYLLQNNANINVSEVIVTFIYKYGVSNPGYGTAVGLFNSAVGLIFVIISNTLSKKFAETSIW